jgi:hypothetical protein
MLPRVSVLGNRVVKTAVKAVVIIVSVLIVAFMVISFASPDSVATYLEQTGHYSYAAKYATLSYAYSGDIYDLARCVEDGILCEDNNIVLDYGEKLIADADFEQVVIYKNSYLSGDYRQFICGRVAIARYLNGNFSSALSLAYQVNGEETFESGNALIALGLKVISLKDSQNSVELLQCLMGISPTDVTQRQLLDQLKIRLKGII